jgi:hypothetical protein
MPYWDGVEAAWVWHNRIAYLRFRNGDDPNRKSIRISSNDGLVVGAQRRSAIEITGAYNTVRDFNIRGMNCALAIKSYARNNIIEHNYLEHGQHTVYVRDAASRNIIRNNEIVASMYGFNDFGPWIGYGSPSALVKKRWRAYHWAKKYEYASTAKAVSLVCTGPGNVIVGNHVHNGSVGISIGLHVAKPPASGTIVASNNVHNMSSVGLTIDGGHTDTKIHDNFVQSANIAFRWQNVNATQASARQVHFYRNRSLMDANYGIHNYWHHLANAGTAIPTVWYYHNSASGGYLWTSFLDVFLPYDGLSKVHFVNNILSASSPMGATSKFLADAGAIGSFDYNFVRASSFKASWAGSRNILTTSYAWQPTSLVSFGVDSVPVVVGAGLDLSKQFKLRGISYAALPGMSPGYFKGTAPDLGAIQKGLSAPSFFTVSLSPSALAHQPCALDMTSQPELFR